MFEAERQISLRVWIQGQNICRAITETFTMSKEGVGGNIRACGL